MSGKDEMPSLQCPICDSSVKPTAYWSAFVGRGQVRNWCRLYFDKQMRILRLDRERLLTTEALQKIDSIKCRPRRMEAEDYRDRHVFYSNSLIFRRVKEAILSQDALMRSK